MNRFASTRSDSRASQPWLPAQWRVGSIDEDGIRYGLTTQALIAKTIATAPAIVTIQSIATRQGRGSRCVILSIGLRERRDGAGSGGGNGGAPGWYGGGTCGAVVGKPPFAASSSARRDGSERSS